MNPERRRWRGWLAAGLTIFVVGCDGQDADRLVRLSRKAMDRVQTQATNPQGQLMGPLHSIRGGWTDLTLDMKVAARLRWDSNLQGADIQVRTLANGIVELRGKVTDLSVRQRAVSLARSTVGVQEVRDQLTE